MEGYRSPFLAVEVKDLISCYIWSFDNGYLERYHSPFLAIQVEVLFINLFIFLCGGNLLHLTKQQMTGCVDSGPLPNEASWLDDGLC